MFAALFNKALCSVEGLFPLTKTVTEEEQKSSPFWTTECRWIPEEDYYFLEDRSYRFGQRIRAVVGSILHRCNHVSFWRKREKLLNR